MKTGIFAMILLCIVPIAQNAFACSRDLTHLFWSPIIDRVSGDCSFVGYEINPSGVIFTGILAVVFTGFAVWRAKR